MGQYIDKNALVAEIDNILDYADEHWDTDYAIGAKRFADKFQDTIDTIEVKEVDLDSERRKYLTEHFNVYEDGFLQSKRSNLPLDTYDVIKLAKHFFELGLSVNNPITAADRGTAEEIILALNTLGEEKMISYDKEIEWLNKLKKL